MNAVIEGISEDIKDHWVSSNEVSYVHNPSPLTFLRDFVGSYQPVIITGLVDHWPALNWTLDSISTNNPDSIAVNITPDGHGDCVKKILDTEFFVYPSEELISWSCFSDMLCHPKCGDAVPYLSYQNDNLRKQFPLLMNDIDESFPLAQSSMALSEAEAINLWIGDERSVSSLHKDFFENFYVVIKGEKTFTLFPPTDIIYMQEKEYPTRRYKRQNVNDSKVDNNEIAYNQRRLKSEYVVVSEDCPSEALSWISLDPEDTATTEKHPYFKYTHPIRCTVKAGEVLYLPAMWYHRVSQNCLTIAVNYWYDMRFDFRYVFNQMARRLATITFNQYREDNNQDNCEGTPNSLGR